MKSIFSIDLSGKGDFLNDEYLSYRFEWKSVTQLIESNLVLIHIESFFIMDHRSLVHRSQRRKVLIMKYSLL